MQSRSDGIFGRAAQARGKVAQNPNESRSDDIF
jgi:hypothetical protein